MIRKNLYRLKKFCCEDISLIENYNEAANSSEKWQCHHKLEITLHKTSKELIEIGLYYNRPASELIFLTEKEHKSIHYKSGMSNFSTKYGKDNPMYGSHHSEDTKQKLRKPKRKYKWLTPTGEIRIMDMGNVLKYHPDWIKIGEA